MKRPIAICGTLILSVGLCAALGAYTIRPGSPVKVWIITYHSVSPDPAAWSPYTISPEELEEDLRWLRDNGYQTVLTQDLVNFVIQGTPLPDKPVMLTFDDGYRDNNATVLPLLQKYGARAVISLIVSAIDKTSEIDWAPEEYREMLTWAEARALAGSGLIELGNHTYALHRDTPERLGCAKRFMEPVSNYQAMLTADVKRAQETICAQTGVFPAAFTYPYGAVSGASAPVLRALGFLATFTTETGCSVLSADPACLYGLRRNNRPHGKPAEEILSP